MSLSFVLQQDSCRYYFAITIRRLGNIDFCFSASVQYFDIERSLSAYPSLTELRGGFAVNLSYGRLHSRARIVFQATLTRMRQYAESGKAISKISRI